MGLMSNYLVLLEMFYLLDLTKTFFLGFLSKSKTAVGDIYLSQLFMLFMFDVTIFQIRNIAM